MRSHKYRQSFDKFFQRHFWGITDDDRKNTIPNLIYKKYPDLFSN